MAELLFPRRASPELARPFAGVQLLESSSRLDWLQVTPLAALNCASPPAQGTELLRGVLYYTSYGCQSDRGPKNSEGCIVAITLHGKKTLKM